MLLPVLKIRNKGKMEEVIAHHNEIGSEIKLESIMEKTWMAPAEIKVHALSMEACLKVQSLRESVSSMHGMC